MSLHETLGLPTYPIADGMTVGIRTGDELEWLLDHGIFESRFKTHPDLELTPCYHQIVKVSLSQYQVVAVDRRTGKKSVVWTYKALHDLLWNQDVHLPDWTWNVKAE